MSIEVAFHDSKQSLGFEEPQGWSRRAVERTAPLAMLLYRQCHSCQEPFMCSDGVRVTCRAGVASVRTIMPCGGIDGGANHVLARAGHSRGSGLPAV